jgi:hypothetical protein
LLFRCGQESVRLASSCKDEKSKSEHIDLEGYQAPGLTAAIKAFQTSQINVEEYILSI